MIDWKSLKSGSDIRGTAIQTENDEVNLTNEAIECIVVGFYAWLVKKLRKTDLKVAVGRDSRLSGERIAKVVTLTLKNLGVQVLDLGLSSTPAMFMITVDDKFSADASVQITASHHPFDKNGLKFFTKDGGLEGADITEILQNCNEGVSFSSKVGQITSVDYMKIYARNLVKFVRERTGAELPLKGLKIIVDAGNGVGGFYATDVLQPLGADTRGSQFLEPDGRFPNHVPNPENKDAMKSVCDAVKSSRADFGIIFDTDVDRAGAVDSEGNEINRNRLIALISAILLEEQSPATIVTDSVTSDGLAEFIESRGGAHHRFMRGYKNVINECIRLNNEGVYSPLAIETSGHAALKENYYLDDGAYLITRLLVSLAAAHKSGKNLLDKVKDLKMPLEEIEIRLQFKIADFKEYGNTVINELKASFPEKLAKTNYEGARFSFDHGFALIRMSVHDPIMPINIESGKVGGVGEIAAWLLAELNKYHYIDARNLERVVKG